MMNRSKVRIIGNIMLVVIAFLLLITYYVLPINAAESTSSATVREKLEALKEEIASKAAKLKQEINLKLQNKAYIGSVKTKTENSITLATPAGAKIISINEDTTYENFDSKVKTKFSFKTLTEENYIAALGDIDDTGVLTAKKIILHTSSNNKKELFWGQIIAISDTLLTIKNKAGKNISVAIDKDTIFQKGQNEILLSKIKLNDTVSVSGYNEEELFEASLIYIQTPLVSTKQSVATKSAKVATSSAKINPTPKSATPAGKKR